VILLFAVAIGLIAGFARAAITRAANAQNMASNRSLQLTDDSAMKQSAAMHHRFAIPSLQGGWLLVIAFLPQLFVFYVPLTSRSVSDGIAASALTMSQVLLLIFGWQNRHQRAFYLLIAGLLANFIVIVSNGGLMPMSPETLNKLVSPERAASWQMGERLGQTKDRLMAEENTRVAILSDRMVLPKWTGYAIAYSIGDVFIALGAFWFLWDAGKI